MKYIFSKFLSLIMIMLSLPLLIIIAILIKLDSKGPIIFWSKRVGFKNKIFYMPKFRSMFIGTPTSSTKLLKEPRSHITKIGKYKININLHAEVTVNVNLQVDKIDSI